MYNITHDNTAVSAEELGKVTADCRTKANLNFKCQVMGAVTAQLHGSFVAREYGLQKIAADGNNSSVNR